MTKDESIICSLDKIKRKIKIRSGDYMEAIGKDTISIDIKREKDISIKYSWHFLWIRTYLVWAKWWRNEASCISIEILAQSMIRRINPS